MIRLGLAEATRMNVYDPSAKKIPVRLTINGDLIVRARAEGLDVSSLAEEAIAKEMARLHRANWDAVIRTACDEHDAYVAENGTLAEQVWASWAHAPWHDDPDGSDARSQGCGFRSP
jgi:post-segregation antitoxin (ccd killing protein)